MQPQKLKRIQLVALRAIFRQVENDLNCLFTFSPAENLKDTASNTQNKNAPTQGARKVPRSVSVVAKSGSSLAKSAPVQIPDPVKRSYSLNFLRERMSDGEIADGRCFDRVYHIYVDPLHSNCNCKLLY